MKSLDEYAETYHLGKAVVHIVAPPPMTEEELKRRLEEMQSVAWSIIYKLAANGVQV
ncbi:MAG: hypothetical protein WA118_04440 [Carboxydocellales bacterium]